MTDRPGRPDPSEAIVLIDRPETCVVVQDGALVSIRRALLARGDLDAFCDVLEEAARWHPRMVLLASYRLDPRFPIPADFDADLAPFVRALRLVERRLSAIASVLEFGGVRAAAMRLASSTVWALGRTQCELATFQRLSSAAAWLEPHAVRAGLPHDLATYVRSYRAADARLRRHDQALGGGP